MWIENEIEELENQGFDWDEVKELAWYCFPNA